MGSIAYAIGGALEGAGKGGAEIGSEMAQGDMHSAILRMQHKFAMQQQQAGFAFERGMAHQKAAEDWKKLGFSSQAGYLAQQRAQSAQFKLAQMQRETQLAGYQYRYAGMVDSVAERAAGRGGGEQDKWQHVPSGQSVPNPGGGPDIMTNQPLLMSPHGRLYAQVGQDLVPYDYTKRGPMDLKTGNNGKPFDPQSDAARKALLADPTKIMPSGISARDYYESRYGVLPNGFNDAYDRANAAKGGGGNSASIKSRIGGKSNFDPANTQGPDTSGNAEAQERLQQQVTAAQQDEEDARDREFATSSQQSAAASGGLDEYNAAANPQQ